MGSAEWSVPLGIMVYIVAIVFATIYYLRYKKIYLISFIASIATYVFAVFYFWDVFDLNQNWVLLMLVISSILMVYLGKYFSKFDLKPTKSTSLKEKGY